MKLGKHVLEKKTVFLLVFLTLNLTVDFYYTFFGYRASFNSDAAALNLYAISIKIQGELFPSNWFYVNGDFWLFGPHLLMYLLNYIFVNQFVIHGISVFIFYLLIIGLNYKLLKLLKFTTNESIFGVSILLSIVSISVKEFFYLQGAYSGIYVCILLSLVLLLKLISKIEKQKIPLQEALLLSVVFSVLILSNPFRALQWLIVPCAVYVFIYLRQKNYVKKFILSLKWFFLFSILPILATAFYFWNYSQHTVQNAIREVPTNDFDKSWNGLGVFLNAFFWLLGIAPGANHKQISIGTLDGFVHTLLMIFALRIFLQQRRNLNLNSERTLIFLLMAAIPSCYLIIFSGLGVDATAGRYILIPTYIGLTIIFAVIFKSGSYQKVLIMIIIPFLFIANVKDTNLMNHDLIDQQSKVLSEIEQYSDLGATYWNASKYQILSNDEVRIQPILWNQETCFTSYDWLTSRTLTNKKVSHLLIFDNEWAEISKLNCNFGEVHEKVGFRIASLIP
jgi:hypothetical protein